MTEKYYVICGNHQEFQNFIRRKAGDMWVAGDTSVSLSNFVFINDFLKLKGIRNPHGWFVGTWYNLPGLQDILTHLIISTDDGDPQKFVEICEKGKKLRESNS